jgi:hypothetical protein
LLKIIGFIKNINVEYVTNPKIAEIVLKTSNDKGYFIEHLIAMNAWKPVISLESVNGDKWIFQKKIFMELVPHLPSFEKLKNSVEIVLSYYPNDIFIDSVKLANIIAEIMIYWLFDIKFEDEWNFIGEASFEWRKEIAIKGKADINIKHKTVNLFKNIILKSKYYFIFKEKWNKPEYYSLFLQPFILSPMINITDIAVTLNRNKNLSIFEAIHYFHPFPILERYIKNDLYMNNSIIVKSNTQVFIPLDLIGKMYDYDKAKRLLFGLGNRQCAGKHYALAIMEPLFKNLKNRTNYYPELNHRYSGRNNDNLDIDIFYFISIICKSIVGIN